MGDVVDLFPGDEVKAHYNWLIADMQKEGILHVGKDVGPLVVLNDILDGDPMVDRRTGEVRHSHLCERLGFDRKTLAAKLESWQSLGIIAYSRRKDANNELFLGIRWTPLFEDLASCLACRDYEDYGEKFLSGLGRTPRRAGKNSQSSLPKTSHINSSSLGLKRTGERARSKKSEFGMTQPRDWDEHCV